MSLAKPIEWGPTVVPSTSEAPGEWPSPSTTRPAYGRRSSPPPAMRVISALAPVVALCVSYILGTALAAALGLEPVTVGAPVAVVLFGTVLLFFSVGESRRRTTRQLVPSLRFDLRLAGTALVIGVLAAVLLAPVVEKGKATASAGHLLILALPALLMLPLARLFRARAMHRTKERVVVVGSGPGADAVARRLSLHPLLPLLAPSTTRVPELSSMVWPI